MIEVSIIQDSDCHWYIIPKEDEEYFHYLNEQNRDNQEWYEEFNIRFSQYSTGGDISCGPKLYADIE